MQHTLDLFVGQLAELFFRLELEVCGCVCWLCVAVCVCNDMHHCGRLP